MAGATALLLVGCGERGDDPGAGPSQPIEIALPTGEGSGEPHLSPHGDTVWMSWLEPVDETWALRVMPITETGTGAPTTVVERDDFFVNWADVPSVTALDDGRLAAHWLERGSAGTYDYGVRIAWSDDGGRSWSDPWTPHEDGTPTEHGFVSLLPQRGGGLGVVWLDGRRFVDGPDGAGTKEMALRFRDALGPGQAESEVVVDPRVCDCCQTGAAPTSDGWVIVYRDRSEDEVRDIYAARWSDGKWTEGRPVHRDGWHIAACPVNGPAVDADGDEVAVAWFTGAGEVPRVSVAFSRDQGTTFSEPIRVDDGSPIGRVDVLLDAEGALVSWIERVADGAELRVRRVRSGGSPGDVRVVTAMGAARASGFPRMVRLGDDLLFAWTDASSEATRVRLARLEEGRP